MTLRAIPSRLLALALAALLTTGCPASDPGADPACEPACAAGFLCTAGLCEKDPGYDAGAATDGPAMGSCTPACSGVTPHCSPAGKCVACLEDEDCPIGNICKALAGGQNVCAAGCTDDTRCAMGQKCCDAACVAVQTDLKNCGACGMACTAMNATATCLAGVCGSGPCRGGFGDCNGNAADGCESALRVDPANCGACGKQCLYKNGIAACANDCYLSACEFGYDECNGDEMDGCETSVLTDAKNCGGCGMPCKAIANGSVICANATCQVGQCSVGFEDCNQMPGDGCEVNTATDAKNCGACGLACPQGLICKGGGCTCPNCNIPNASALCVNNQCIFDKCNPGWFDCNGNQADGCEANIGSDAKNCGQCGNVCPQNLPSCYKGMCNPLYIFQGIQQNLPIAQLAGWSECYKDVYSNSATPIAQILAGCNKGRLLIACRPTGNATLQLAAMGDRADVTFNVGNMANGFHESNNVRWYFSDSHSWGFVGPGDTPQRNSCDTGNTNPALRMCWHTGGTKINSGYRCGNNFLNGSNAYERLVYHAD